MARSRESLTSALEKIKTIKSQFWNEVRVPGANEEFNQELEKAGRVADFIELGQLMVQDALHREESCGGHFRLEYQTPEGEAMRRDEAFMYVGAYEYKGDNVPAELHKEELQYEVVHPSQRSYK